MIFKFRAVRSLKKRSILTDKSQQFLMKKVRPLTVYVFIVKLLDVVCRAEASPLRCNRVHECFRGNRYQAPRYSASDSRPQSAGPRNPRVSSCSRQSTGPFWINFQWTIVKASPRARRVPGRIPCPVISRVDRCPPRFRCVTSAGTTAIFVMERNLSRDGARLGRLLFYAVNRLEGGIVSPDSPVRVSRCEPDELRMECRARGAIKRQSWTSIGGK